MSKTEFMTTIIIGIILIVFVIIHLSWIFIKEYYNYFNTGKPKDKKLLLVVELAIPAYVVILLYTLHYIWNYIML